MRPELARACGWIDAHLGDFVVDVRGERAPARRMAAIKGAGDLAHGADFLERSADPDAVATGRRWMEVAWRQIEEGEAIRELIAADARFAPAAVTFLPFHLSGRTSARLQGTLAAQIRHAVLPALGWTMTVPALAMFDIEPLPAMVEQARQLSVLAHRTPAAALPQDAVYVLAHEIMYATRWGRQAPAWDDPTARYVAEVLPALADRFVALGDADVLAEVLVAMHAATGDGGAPRAWGVLAAAQTPAGNVEPPAQLVTLFPRLPHPVLTRTAHTTLVSIMAWAARAQRDSERAQNTKR